MYSLGPRSAAGGRTASLTRHRGSRGRPIAGVRSGRPSRYHGRAVVSYVVQRRGFAMIGIFDGHNDTVHRLREYCPDGIDFLTRSTDGHLDLPRALDGGLGGGLFAMFVRPETPPADDLTVTATSYEVRLA